MTVSIKTVVSVTEMARMVNLSRPRFYELIGRAFPYPTYDVSNRRPYYVQEAQEVCLEVRRSNRGVDGKPILFYSRRSPARSTVSKTPKANKSKPNAHTDLLAGLKSLGLLVTSSEVADAISTLFPNGAQSIEPSELLRSVFVHLKTSGASTPKL